MVPKFIAWDRQEKCYWIVGSIHFSEGTIDIYRINPDRKPGESGQISNYNMPIFDRFILKQSIGLEDKHGKAIFEGSVMECNIERGGKLKGEIAWGKYNAGFHLGIGDRTIAVFRQKSPSSPTIKEMPDGRIDGEIIGDIHNDPQLLANKPCEKKCGRSTDINSKLCGDCGLEEMVIGMGGTILKEKP